MDNDRCSMAHSIEGRFPFLSQKLLSLTFQLPPEWNVATHGIMQEKIMLRQVAAGCLPVSIWQDRVKSPLPVPDARSYHQIVMKRLETEIEQAHQDVWKILNKQVVIEMIDAFRVRAWSVGPNNGESLTSYIALGQPPHVRTAQLFAILTFLRWYELCIEQPERNCYA
jgi:asparagine synthetase B (glutamine-hydrolysing)